MVFEIPLTIARDRREASMTEVLINVRNLRRKLPEMSDESTACLNVRERKQLG